MCAKVNSKKRCYENKEHAKNTKLPSFINAFASLYE